MSQDPRLPAPSSVPTAARLVGLVAGIVTAGVVSWATPDGNLVVTLVPALVVGLIAFGLALRWFRRAAGRRAIEDPREER